MEVRNEPALADLYIPVAPVDDARHVRVVLARIQPLDQRGERLSRVARDAQVRAHVLQALRRQYAERRPSAKDGRVAQPPYPLDYLPDPRQIPDRILAALVIQVPNGQPHQVRPEVPHRRLHVPAGVIREHQIQNPQLMPTLIHARRQISQPNRNRPDHHPVHKPIRPISSNKQDFHTWPRFHGYLPGIVSRLEIPSLGRRAPCDTKENQGRG